MGRVLPLFALLGSIGLGAFALADESAARVSEAPSVPNTGESLNGGGDVNSDAKTKQEEAAAIRGRKPKAAPNDRAKDKYKASQSGNDAALRQLPSPAQRGSE
jgi:hypothetical protein